eukprot:m.165843 g.165843  ORF g.165843 m.165843 type:complete len:51 (+) comp10334_c0_seq1:191-343(+)
MHTTMFSEYLEVDKVCSISSTQACRGFLLIVNNTERAVKFYFSSEYIFSL